jgi:hypothetical protein
MATAQASLFCGDLPRPEYGAATIRPWTIGWDEEDTRIRLRFIARAWVQSCPGTQPGGADKSKLVRAAISTLRREPLWPCHGYCRAGCSSGSSSGVERSLMLISNDINRIYFRIRPRRGHAGGIILV